MKYLKTFLLGFSLFTVILLLAASDKVKPLEEHFTEYSNIGPDLILNTENRNALTFTKCSKKNEGVILKNIFKRNNIKREHDTDNWDIYIPCGYNNVEKELKQIKVTNPEQKIFGINGCDSIVSKNSLWTLINKKYGRTIASRIMPETYVLNNYKDIQLFKRDYNENNIYILKKNIQNKKGLKLTNNYNEIVNAKKDKFKVVQKYIKDVFLINNRKINLRLYLLLVCNKTGVKPYLYKEGKCIYTNKDYNANDIMDLEGNITSLNLNQDIYNDNPFSIEELKIFLRSRNYNEQILFNRIKGIMIDVYEAINGKLCNLKSLKNNTSFQLFGADVIFDKQLSPYILEFNKGPEMKPKNKRDVILKTKLNEDMFNIINVIEVKNNMFERIS